MIEITQEEVMQNWNGEIPLVSVCCITYNQEPYIAQALDGFLMQKTSFPFEILIHDDASTDRTADIIREYEAKFPKLIKPIYQKENQYSKGNRSILASFVYPRAKGKYIALCEGDDYWIDENKLQMQVDFLEGNPEYTMCFHNAEVLNEIPDTEVSSIYGAEDRDYESTELYKKWIVPTASIVLRRKCLEYPIIEREKFWAGDVIVIQSAVHQGKVYGFSKVMSVYRVSQHGVSWEQQKKDKEHILKDSFKILNHQLAIKMNFPKIDNKVIDYDIAERYIQISYLTSNVIDKIKYLKNAFSLIGFKMIGLFVKKVFRKIFSKF